MVNLRLPGEACLHLLWEFAGDGSGRECFGDLEDLGALSAVSSRGLDSRSSGLLELSEGYDLAS